MAIYKAKQLYKASFKLEVIGVAEDKGKLEADTLFGIDRKPVLRQLGTTDLIDYNAYNYEACRMSKSVQLINEIKKQTILCNREWNDKLLLAKKGE